MPRHVKFGGGDLGVVSVRVSGESGVSWRSGDGGGGGGQVM